MISKRINLSTGPVSLHPLVCEALTETPISHRSPGFHTLYGELSEFLCRSFHVRDTYIFSGSGTAANEAMILQISQLKSKGIILSNGEFGNRLVEQATRRQLQFLEYTTYHGVDFNLNEIRKLILSHQLKWILFCHCETSTGVLNNITSIAEICNELGCLCFVDCISTVGCLPINLSNVAMATASSGKGLCSIAGLAIVFSNINVTTDHYAPKYFDLKYHQEKHKIPFTISSNLLRALYAGCKLKLNQHNYDLVDLVSNSINSLLKGTELLPYKNFHVFTITHLSKPATVLASELSNRNIEVSYQSEYLQKMNSLQLALFSVLNEAQLDTVLESLKEVLKPGHVQKKNPTSVL